jgi:hypothetical protein
MAVEPNVVINLGAEFVGKKAFKQADTALTKLTGSAKKLAGAVGVAYGVKAIASYGKAAMKAAADDQKAQKILASNLKNVGLAYASVDAESFISSMEKQTAILDDQLRPAYGQLATVTGSATKTQELMQLAFDVSSGSGLDYASTVDILSKAYVGNTEGLKQLNLGLTKAELKSMDFAQIQTKLRQNFAGAGGTALDSYAGSMAKLSVATSNASETIGTALLDAMIKITGSQGVDGLISKIDTLASAFASVVTEVGNAVSALTGTAAQKAFSPAYYVSGGKAGGKTVAATGAGNMALSVLSQDTQKSDLAARKKAENDAIKRNKELAKLAKEQAAAALATTKAKKEQAKLDKAIAAGQLALGKGADVFDMDKIQINAALIGQAEALGKATTGSQILAIANDVQRLKVKQDIAALEDAIASKDEAAILKATAKLNEDLKILGALQKQDAKLLDINRVLAGMKSTDLINLANLQAALDLLAKFKFPTLTIPGVVIPTPITPGLPGPGVGGRGADAGRGSTFGPSPLDDFLDAVEAETERGGRRGGGIGDTNYVALPPGFNSVDEYLKESRGNRGASDAGTVIVNVNAGAVGDENIIVDAVQNAMNEIARRGYLTTYAGAIAV